MNDDAQLIEATLSGDSTAFGGLVRKYQDRLYNTMVRATGCADDALDVVQDAFVQAFRKLSTFRQSSAFYTWLYRIAFNVAASHRRRRKPAASVDEARESSGLEPVDPQPGPHDQAERAERCRQVEEAMATLTDDHRAVLVLREIDGCCYETIADVLDVPVGTVRSRLHRARLQLREELREVLAVGD
ncbi:MAG: RNA polymerase sigma factor [Planctomycetota bacterium]